MNTKKTKQCETTGVNAALIRKAVAAWKRSQKDIGIPLAKFKSQLSYVGSLPPPPTAGTPEYYRCINDWYRCYMQASYLDNYRNQMAQLQQQITNGEIMLTGYLEGYAQCISGFPV